MIGRRGVVVALAALAGLALGGCDRLSSAGKPTFNGVDITGAQLGTDFRLMDHRGTPRSVGDFRGKAVVLFFGFTHCPDMCPTTLADLASVVRMLGPEGNRVQVLFVTVDPRRDTPELLARYVPAFHPDFLGLRGDPEETLRIAKAFKIFVSEVPGRTPESYTIDHSTQKLAFDSRGQLRLLIAHGMSPEKMAADLRLLMNN